MFRPLVLCEGTDRIAVPVLLDTLKGIETVDGPVNERRNPAHRLAAPHPKLEVQALRRHLLDCVLHERRVLFEVGRVGHVRLDVLEGVALGLEIHIDKEIRRVMLKHEAPEQEFAQGSLE